MPILEISREELGPRRGRATLGYVETVMLWPGPADAAKRDWVNKAILATRIDDAISEPGAADRLSLMHDDWAKIAHFLRDAPPMRDIQKECPKPFCQGLAAGFVLCGVLQRREIGDPEAQLGAVMDGLVESVLPSARDFKFALSRSTLDNTVWAKYRCVAHLWASYVWRGIGAAADWTFPTRLDRIGDFFNVAEWFREKGENWRPKGSAQPVLDPLHTWRMP